MDSDRNATLLRYRLGTVAQTRSHLHLPSPGSPEPDARRSLFFFPAAQGLLAPGAPVLVELSFHGSEQTRLLRGAVHGEAAGGAWLEFPRQGLVSSETESGLLSRRQHRRYGADLPVEVQLAGHSFRGRLHDVSLVGARLAGESFALKPSARVALLLRGPNLPDRVGPAIVVWSNRGGAGVYFDREDPACRASVGTLYAALQGAWQDAPEAVHPAGCCQGGLLLEPPLPAA